MTEVIQPVLLLEGVDALMDGSPIEVHNELVSEVIVYMKADPEIKLSVKDSNKTGYSIISLIV